MEKSARNLARMCSILHNCIFRTSYGHAVRNASTYANYSQGTATPQQWSMSDTTRQQTGLSEQDETPEGFSKDLASTVNTSDISSALKYLKHMMVKYKNVRSLDKVILENTTFVNSCIAISKDIRCLSIKEVIFVLRCMQALHIPTNTTIVQKLLQMIRVQVNDLSLTDISSLKRLLSKRTKTPLVIALLRALGPAFEAQIHTRDKSDISELTQILCTACGFNNEEVIETLSFDLLQHHRLSENTMNLIFLYKCLSRASVKTASSALLKFRLEQHFLTQIDSLTYQQAAEILSLICIHNEDEKLRTQKGINQIVLLFDHILKCKPSHTDLLKLVLFSNVMIYSNRPLLDYLANEVKNDSSMIREWPSKILNNVLTCINIAHYESSFVQVIKDELTKRQFLSLPPNLAADCAYNLAALDHFDPHILQHVFSSSQNIDRQSRVLGLYQCVKAFYPAYTGPFPPLTELEKLKNESPTMESIFLKKALIMALKGPEYVKNNLQTKLGHVVQHVIVIRSNNEPVNMETICDDSTVFVEQIKPPSDSQVILIFNIWPELYPINSLLIGRTWLKALKAAEVSTGYRAVAVNEHHLMNNFHHYERIPYLKELIKYRPDNPSIVDYVSSTYVRSKISNADT